MNRSPFRVLIFLTSTLLVLSIGVSAQTDIRRIYAPKTEDLNFVDAISLHVYCSLSKLFDSDARGKCFVSLPSSGDIASGGLSSETIKTLNDIKASIELQKSDLAELRASSSTSQKVINNTIIKYVSSAPLANVNSGSASNNSLHNTVLSKYAHAYGQDNVILTRATGSYILGANIVNAVTGSVQIGTNDRAKLFVGADGFVGIASSTNGWARTTRIADEQLRVGGRVRAAGFDVDSNADLAENFPSDDKEALAGHIIQFSDITHRWQGYDLSGIERASTARMAVGVVATNPGVVLGVGVKGLPVAFSGRVPVKVSAENGPVMKGDRITLSKGERGVGAKLLSAGQSVGIALSSDTGAGTVLMLVRNEYVYDVASSLINSSSSMSASSN